MRKLPDCICLLLWWDMCICSTERERLLDKDYCMKFLGTSIGVKAW